ncbi:MAG: hypothetical protein BM555_04010 [Crocinitomix sp. MedPE-SWsnd]|nr:MAG: hypothetical protein BM555_04010 [Crocinitomix sp. MedPE-SWsnd]
MKKVKSIELVEKKRSFANKRREYFVHVNGEENHSFDIKENSNFFKNLIRMMSGGKDAMAKFKMSLLDASGSELYKIKKGVGPFEMAPFKLCDNVGNPIYIASNKIKMSDDSFVEILNPSKEILFKSGLENGRTWFPVYLYESEKAETGIMTISGEPFAVMSKEKSGGLGRMHSGNVYKFSLAEETDNQETVAMLINFMVAIDFGYDNRN